MCRGTPTGNRRLARLLTHGLRLVELGHGGKAAEQQLDAGRVEAYPHFLLTTPVERALHDAAIAERAVSHSITHLIGGRPGTGILLR